MSLDFNLGPIVSNNLYIGLVPRSYSDKFNVAHLNCRSIRPSLNSTKFDELKSVLCGSNLDVIGISETWLKSDISSHAVEIPGYTFVRNDRRNMRGGGVGIYVSNKLKYTVVFKSSIAGKCESLYIVLYSGSAITIVYELFCYNYSRRF